MASLVSRLPAGICHFSAVKILSHDCRVIWFNPTGARGTCNTNSGLFSKRSWTRQLASFIEVWGVPELSEQYSSCFCRIDDLDEHLARREEASSNLAGPSTTDAFLSVGTREQERPSLLHECIYTWIRHCQTQCMMGNLRATSRRKLDKEAFCVERPSASLIMFFSGLFIYFLRFSRKLA